jgi:hypothetical protein
VYGAGDDHVDGEVMHEFGTTLLFLPFEYRAWNKAGVKLAV